uniref:Si:ch211-286o17.1 n=1 Tax=Sinocyclocheilus grahami TaxID=75366 RepID=A0A672R8Y5_SINGR
MATHRKCHKASNVAFLICFFAALFQGEYNLLHFCSPADVWTQLCITSDVKGEAYQTDPNPPEKNSVTSKVNVVCVDKIPVRYKYDVLLKLKASSTCVSTGLDLSCDNWAESGEIILYNSSTDPEGMAGKFNNDNITDKVEVEEAVSRMGQHSKIVLISLLITGLLLAALLIAGYLLKTNRGQSKGLRLAEDSFQVDQENQGNTLLSVAPLPQQQPLDKPIINGESPESPPNNGHSATQIQVADTPM